MREQPQLVCDTGIAFVARSGAIAHDERVLNEGADDRTLPCSGRYRPRRRADRRHQCKPLRCVCRRKALPLIMTSPFSIGMPSSRSISRPAILSRKDSIQRPNAIPCRGWPFSTNRSPTPPVFSGRAWDTPRPTTQLRPQSPCADAASDELGRLGSRVHHQAPRRGVGKMDILAAEPLAEGSSEQ